jgi:hypothetical protein
VLEGKDGQLDAHHSADLARPETTSVDNVLGVNVALVGVDGPGAVGSVRQRFDHRVTVNLSSAVAGTDGIGVGDTRRVDVAFIWVVETAEEVLWIEQRMQLGGLFHRDHLEAHAEVAATSLSHLQPVEALRRVGEHDAAWEMDAAVLTGLGLDVFVQVDRVLLQLRHVRVAVERVHATGGVPGAAMGQLTAFQQDDVGPTRFGQVVQHACADYSATDHHHPG